MSWIEFEKLAHNPGEQQQIDWHATVTITLGELAQSGFYKPQDDSWKFDYYSVEQYERFCTKFLNRFYWREVGVLPLLRFKMEYLRRLNEIMPKYKLLYKKLDDGLDPFAERDSYGKRREVYSDFPQTQLAGNNADYASNSRDSEYEDVVAGDTIEKLQQFQKSYQDVDALLLDELECLFTTLLTAAINGF